MDRFIVWLAKGFGLGDIPKAPGTFGSVGGIAWFLCLVHFGNLWALITGTFLGIALSVWASGAAEKILAQRDPGSIVIDEIVAIPILFLPWTLSVYFTDQALPPIEYFFQSGHWMFTLLLFVGFRVFDIAKPWPVGPSQKLPGGWGVTIDDVLAALYVALISLLFLA
jgi:phosphatidylglycerophosphatase A